MLRREISYLFAMMLVCFQIPTIMAESDFCYAETPTKVEQREANHYVYQLYTYYFEVDITCETLPSEVNILEQYITKDTLNKYNNPDGSQPDLNFKIKKSTLAFIKPTLFYNLLSRIKLIDFDSNNIEEIGKSLFKDNNNKLEEIIISGNKIKYLDESLFQNLHKLKKLSLSQNALASFNATLDSVEMINIDLSMNIITSLNITANALQSLNLSYNNIQDVKLCNFKTISNLKQLYLFNNNISSLSGGGFMSADNLELLNLSWNKLTTINLGSFLGLEMLTNLILSNNQLISLNVHAFHDLQSLQILDLSGNLMSSINIDLFSKSTLPNINQVSLNNNTWDCDSLISIIRICKDRKLIVTKGTNVSDSSILGIACNNLSTTTVQSDGQISSASNNNLISKIGNTIISKLDTLINKQDVDVIDLKSSKIYNILNDGFQKSEFVKFFEGNFKRFAFFRYFENQMFNYSVQSIINHQNQSTDQNNSTSAIIEILANLTKQFNEAHYDNEPKFGSPEYPSAEKFVSEENKLTNSSMNLIVTILTIQTVFIICLTLIAFVYCCNKFSKIKAMQKIAQHFKRGKSLESNLTIEELECM